MRHFKFILFTIFASLFFVANSYSQTGEWIVGKQMNGFGYPISCADSLNAMIAFYNGNNAHQEIRKTEDGGKTWRAVYIDSGQFDNGLPRRVKSVSYPTPNFAIAEYDSGYVVRTTDGGKTWKEIKFAELNAGFSMAGWHGRISMFDEQYGYLCTNNTGPDRLFGTEDGGLTWSELNRFQGDFFNSVINNVLCLGKGKLICALASIKVPRSAIAVTSDGGKNWKITSKGVFEDYVNLQKFSFLDSLNGFAVGFQRDTVVELTYPLLHRTRDGGYTWAEVKRDVKFLFKHGGSFTISFSDTLNGIMGGVKDIMRTTDGGKTWVSEIDSNSNNSYLSDNWDVFRGKGNKGMAVSAHGFTMSYQLKISGVESGSEVMGGLSISPNPASTELSVRFGVGVSNIRLSSVLGGQLPVTGTEQNGVINYDISNLSSGLYFVTWKEKVGDVLCLVHSKKIVVQR